MSVVAIALDEIDVLTSAPTPCIRLPVKNNRERAWIGVSKLQWGKNTCDWPQGWGCTWWIDGAPQSSGSIPTACVKIASLESQYTQSTSHSCSTSAQGLRASPCLIYAGTYSAEESQLWIFGQRCQWLLWLLFPGAEPPPPPCDLLLLASEDAHCQSFLCSHILCVWSTCPSIWEEMTVWGLHCFSRGRNQGGTWLICAAPLPGELLTPETRPPGSHTLVSKKGQFLHSDIVVKTFHWFMSKHTWFISKSHCGVTSQRERPEFESSLSHETQWVSLGQFLSLSLLQGLVWG